MTDSDYLREFGAPVGDVLSNARAEFEKFSDTINDLKAAGKKTAPNPSEAQKASGNYKKGRFAWKGLTLVIETAKGQYRRGVSKDGTAWSTLIKDHYGYVAGSESGADGDEVDVFVCEDYPDSEIVFVVNQKCDGKFDEHKCIIGCIDIESAKKVYLRNYEKDWDGMGEVTSITVDHFKWWMEHADTSKEVKNGFFAAAENRKKREKQAADPFTGEVTELPYRDRAEMYAMKGGKLYGSMYPHGGFGVYGGGIDEGEDAATAAAREFGEESGHSVTNVRQLPFDPHTLDWKPPFDNPKLAERAKQFRGSRTHYFVGDLGDPIPDAKIDELGRKDPRLYDLDEAMQMADLPAAHTEGPGVVAANKKRMEILKHLKAMSMPQPEEKAAAMITEDEIRKEGFEARNEAARIEAQKSNMGHIRDGYIPCGGCHRRYYIMPDDEKCPDCGAEMRTRLRSMKH